MAINQTLWRIDGDNPVEIKTINLEKEETLENLINQDSSIISDSWLIIGRQVRTGFNNNHIDFLALDRNGNTIIIELKRDKTPRNAVAQGLDYATWAKDLSSTKIIDIFEAYQQKYTKSTETLNEAFRSKFSIELDEENLNQGHQVVVVASELDATTERIINYLNDSRIPINAMFFKVFKDGEVTYLSRAWLIEPNETDDNSTNIMNKVPWNGEFYVSFGENKSRNWDDAMEYGFISAGGGSRYSNMLQNLEVNDRIWVNIPGTGYVGTGLIMGEPVSAQEFEVSQNDQKEKISEIRTKGTYYDSKMNEEEQEYLVPVKWIKKVPTNKAVKQFGFFGNQNIVCKPTSEKWILTIKRLKELWNIDD